MKNNPEIYSVNLFQSTVSQSLCEELMIEPLSSPSAITDAAVACFSDA